MNTIGERIKSERMKQKLTQQKLADCMAKKVGGFSRSALTQIEAGTTKNPKPENFIAAAECLNLNPKWLLYEEKPKYISVIEGELDNKSSPDLPYLEPETFLRQSNDKIDSNTNTGTLKQKVKLLSDYMGNTSNNMEKLVDGLLVLIDNFPSSTDKNLLSSENTERLRNKK